MNEKISAVRDAQKLNKMNTTDLMQALELVISI